MRRRSAAKASRERVRAFSFTRSCWWAASHFFCETIGGVFMAICARAVFPFAAFLLMTLVDGILFLLCFMNGRLMDGRFTNQAEKIGFEKCSEFGEADGENSAGGAGGGDDCGCGC